MATLVVSSDLHRSLSDYSDLASVTRPDMGLTGIACTSAYGRCTRDVDLWASES